MFEVPTVSPEVIQSICAQIERGHHDHNEYINVMMDELERLQPDLFDFIGGLMDTCREGKSDPIAAIGFAALVTFKGIVNQCEANNLEVMNGE